MNGFAMDKINKIETKNPQPRLDHGFVAFRRLQIERGVLPLLRPAAKQAI